MNTDDKNLQLTDDFLEDARGGSDGPDRPFPLAGVDTTDDASPTEATMFPTGRLCVNGVL